ncbi:MAG: hypothetical protein Tp118SUR00d2C21406231_73 [Prokaryotic dsDNA virus sp.]|nr:MAG: hypothetical protein Tp125DCM00d2C40298531_14 [Prokaryotic dsDNA virus sp.]QDP53193.1 MAG: hypothetical protein Tp118SUR00d2C21406231_73 [Prokaryotic dsDNA virus sp.]|tara:strand:+ start:37586 stop:37909 length:324 start_codon:yes stop_codon:yes gene_type:complete
MGTATFSIAKYGRNRGSAAGTVRGEYVDGGAHTTSTTGSNLTDGAAGAGSAITGVVGDVLTIVMDEAARVQFGGVAATATSGHIVPANIPVDLEISASGAISVADIA